MSRGMVAGLVRAAKPCWCANFNFTPGKRSLQRAGRCRMIATTTARGAKTTSKVKLQDLPQGLLPPLPPHERDDEPAPAYPPVIQQHLNNVTKFSNCVVLTRVGSFYELYGEQVEQYAPLLNLKVAQRNTSRGPVAMAGFQFTALDRFLKILVQDLNEQVAISEEVPNSAADQVKSGGRMYDRKVTRVITPGTLIDENFMNPYENNFLLAIHFRADDAVHNSEKPQAHDTTKVGLSWVDLSSGDFFTQDTDAASVGSKLARIAPKEVLLDATFQETGQSQLKNVFTEGGHIITYHKPTGDFAQLEDWVQVLDSPVVEGGPDFSSQEIAAGSLLLDYVRDRLMEFKITLRPPLKRSDSDSMNIDKQSLRGLEIRSTLREGFSAGSLLHAIRKTVTKSGARLLVDRLVSPSMSIPIINSRLDLVAEMLDHGILRESILALLRRSFDTLRLLSKFSMGRGDADDLLGLAKTIEVMGHVSRVVHEHIIFREQGLISEELQDRQSADLSFLSKTVQSLGLDKPKRLAKRIQDSIDEDSLSRQHLAEEAEAAEVAGYAEQIVNEDDDSTTVKRPKVSAANKADPLSGEIWIMRRSASAALRRLHGNLENLAAEKDDLAESLRIRLSSNTLLLKWSAQHSYFCHVKGKDTRAEISGARTISTSKSTRSFYLPEWTDMGHRISDAKNRIREEEQRVFASIRNEVIENLVKLRRNAAVLDELDVACSSATLAKERNLVRPILHSGTTHKIIGGRHPMVDVGLQTHGRSFTSNDCSMGPDERILLITGPNMAGKSTYLRQNALISILAQTGCFVPADYAEIGLVDKVFSRVGSADNLYNHQSTFMVEMLEVAEILNQATPCSFVIMDEVGRGTTPEDGVAVGYACLHHLHEKNQSRTLFATHFHALTDMTRDFDKLACYCTDVAEDEDGSWVYVHKLRNGVNRQSHALKVARLAGIPEEAIAIAQKVLEGQDHRSHQQATDRQVEGDGESEGEGAAQATSHSG